MNGHGSGSMITILGLDNLYLTKPRPGTKINYFTAYLFYVASTQIYGTTSAVILCSRF